MTLPIRRKTTIAKHDLLQKNCIKTVDRVYTEDLSPVEGHFVQNIFVIKSWLWSVKEAASCKFWKKQIMHFSVIHTKKQHVKKILP